MCYQIQVPRSFYSIENAKFVERNNHNMKGDDYPRPYYPSVYNEVFPAYRRGV